MGFVDGVGVDVEVSKGSWVAVVMFAPKLGKCSSGVFNDFYFIFKGVRGFIVADVAECFSAGYVLS